MVPLFCAIVSFLLAGCGESPKDVFKELKAAALKKDSQVVWLRLTPAAKESLAREAVRAFPQLRGALESGGLKGDSTEVYEYLRSLIAGLDDIRLQYIRSLIIDEVKIEADIAVVTLKSVRHRPPDVPLTLRKVEGRWLWEATEAIEAYRGHRGDWK
jgi:hypothetical protein